MFNFVYIAIQCLSVDWWTVLSNRMSLLEAPSHLTSISCGGAYMSIVFQKLVKRTHDGFRVFALMFCASLCSCVLVRVSALSSWVEVFCTMIQYDDFASPRCLLVSTSPLLDAT